MCHDAVSFLGKSPDMDMKQSNITKKILLPDCYPYFTNHSFFMYSIVHRTDFQIIGGQNADIGEYPWMAEMYYFNLPSCAGTLISEDYVLTAAQCVDGVYPYVILEC